MTDKKQHYNILIATPGHSLIAAYVESLLKTIKELDRLGITWLYLNKYASHVGDARDITIGGPDPQDANDSRPLKGEVTYDKIIWIDSDISWTPEQFLKLYYSDKDIVSGAYLLSNGMVVAYRDVFKGAYLYDEVLSMKDPVKVRGIGFGFVAVKQGVFESISRPWFQQTYLKTINEDGSPGAFPIMGEDISWCERVSEKGFDIWFDPTIKVNHHKTMILTWEGPR